MARAADRHHGRALRDRHGTRRDARAAGSVRHPCRPVHPVGQLGSRGLPDGVHRLARRLQAGPARRRRGGRAVPVRASRRLVDADRQRIERPGLRDQAHHLPPASAERPRAHPHTGDRLQLPQRPRRVLHLDQLHAGRVDRAEAPSEVSLDPLGRCRHGDRPHLPVARVDGRPLAQRRDRRCASRPRMVGVRALVA